MGFGSVEGRMTEVWEREWYKWGRKDDRRVGVKIREVRKRR